MKIGAFNKFSLIDYPGNTTAIIFTQGCNLRCPYCHNPELVLPELFIPGMPFNTILEFLKKRKSLLDAVEFTGGEPTLQPDLLDKMRRIKALGYKIKLDTNGTNPRVVYDAIHEKLVDYVAMDVKNSLGKYAQTTGVTINTDAILDSIEIIKSIAPDHEFRTTVIKGFHTVSDLREIAELLRGAKRYFIQKAHFDKTLAKGFRRKPFELSELREFCNEFLIRGIPCKIR